MLKAYREGRLEQFLLADDAGPAPPQRPKTPGGYGRNNHRQTRSHAPRPPAKKIMNVGIKQAVSPQTQIEFAQGKTSTYKKTKFSASELKLTEQQRIEVMEIVKKGHLSVDEAMEYVLGYDREMGGNGTGISQARSPSFKAATSTNSGNIGEGYNSDEVVGQASQIQRRIARNKVQFGHARTGEKGANRSSGGRVSSHQISSGKGGGQRDGVKLEKPVQRVVFGNKTSTSELTSALPRKRGEIEGCEARGNKPVIGRFRNGTVNVAISRFQQNSGSRVTSGSGVGYKITRRPTRTKRPGRGAPVMSGGSVVGDSRAVTHCVAGSDADAGVSNAGVSAGVSDGTGTSPQIVSKTFTRHVTSKRVKFCTQCGTPAAGVFCAECGHKHELIR